jgi:hypothetical protein
MKVLDIILETVTGETAEYVWKFLGKQTAKAAFGREVAKDIATEVFNTYAKKGLAVPRAELDRLLDARLSKSQWKDDIAFMEQVERDTVGYYNKLYKDWKAGTKVKPKEEPDAPAVLPAHIKNQALKARSAWKSLSAKGLYSKVLYAWQLADVWEAVSLYWEQMDWALDKLSVGPDGVAEDGKPGFSLEAFHNYHKEVLAVLFAQLVATFPSAWNKVPVLGWASAIVSNKVTGLAGKTLWLSFLDAHKFGGDLSIRNFIDNFMLWQLNAIPIIGPLLFSDKVTVASVIGQPLVWTEDLIKSEWVKFLKATAYKDSDIPAGLLPTDYPNPSKAADAAAEAERKKQAGKVGPADADGQAETDPTARQSDKKRPPNKNPNGDWEDMGNGFEVDRMTNHVRVKRY